MKLNNLNKVILTDCDGVLMNWEYAMNVWMQSQGYEIVKDGQEHYDMGDRYGLTHFEKKKLVRQFNESAAIGFLPPLRDAMYYVDLLHRKHGYVFHAITSLSTDPSAGKLREENLRKLFGPTAFEKVQCIGTGADKDEALEPYRGSYLWWIEDKVENAELGDRLGLHSMLMEHGHNMFYDNDDIHVYKNWKEIYEVITNDTMA